jgi:hypothetical protein
MAAYLSDEDRNCDVVDLDVGPGDITHQALSADPRLQTCSVQAAGNGNAVEVNVGDIGKLALTLTQ